MLDIPHAGALPAILFDNLIRMPVGEDINRVLSRPIQPSCLEGCWLLPRLRSCLAHSDHTAALSRAKISALLTSRGQGGQRAGTWIQARSDADGLVGRERVNTEAQCWALADVSFTSCVCFYLLRRILGFIVLIYRGLCHKLIFISTCMMRDCSYLH